MKSCSCFSGMWYHCCTIGHIAVVMENGAVMMVGDVLEKNMFVMGRYIVKMDQMKLLRPALNGTALKINGSATIINVSTKKMSVMVIQEFLMRFEDRSGHANCGDGSDENLSMCQHWNCPNGFWKCNLNNRCLRREKVCDGNYDFHIFCDESDALCHTWNCSAGMWKCDDNKQCINIRSVCDGLTGYGSDEANCVNWICPEEMWKCTDGAMCIDNELVCDGSHMRGCLDKSDENLNVCKNWTCPVGKQKCRNETMCIPEASILNGFIDCTKKKLLSEPIWLNIRLKIKSKPVFISNWTKSGILYL